MFLLAHTKENGRCGMASSISAIKLPVAAFHRRVAGCPGQGQRFAAKIQMRRQPSASRTGNDDRSPQARRHWLALSAESAIRLAERTARPKGGKPPPASQVVSKCALREKKEAERPGFPERPTPVKKNDRVEHLRDSSDPSHSQRERPSPKPRPPGSAAASGLFAPSPGLWPALPPAVLCLKQFLFVFCHKKPPLVSEMMNADTAFPGFGIKHRGK